MIFWFSGAGNSLYVAKRIADATGDRLISMSECVDNDKYEFEVQQEERVGIVCPTYFYSMPRLVARFVPKLKLKNQTYVYLYATCGGSTGQLGNDIKNALAANNITLNAQFSVEMADTWTPMFDLTNKTKVAALNEKAFLKIAEDIESIKNKKPVADMMGVKPKLFCRLMQKLYKLYDKTSNFTLDDTCIGCGLCAKNCPNHAIEMRDKKPVWTKESCDICLKCLHHCPKFSIQYGKHTRKHGQYTIE